MTKLEFILALNEKLSELPKSDREERLNFYSEMIEDRMEEGLSEAEAIDEIGSVDEIAAQILAEFSPSKASKQPPKPKRKLKAWEIVLISVGSPLWASLGLAAFAVIFSLYLSLWAVIIALWACFGALVGSASGVLLAGIYLALNGKVLTGVAMMGVALVCAGLAIFAFFGGKALSKGAVLLIKKMISGIKNRFSKKEEA